MQRMRKGHRQGVEQRAIRSQVTFIAPLCGVAVETEQDASLHTRCDSVTNCCNTTTMWACEFVRSARLWKSHGILQFTSQE